MRVTRELMWGMLIVQVQASSFVKLETPIEFSISGYVENASKKQMQAFSGVTSIVLKSMEPGLRLKEYGLPRDEISRKHCISGHRCISLTMRSQMEDRLQRSLSSLLNAGPMLRGTELVAS